MNYYQRYFANTVGFVLVILGVVSMFVLVALTVGFPMPQQAALAAFSAPIVVHPTFTAEPISEHADICGVDSSDTVGGKEVKILSIATDNSVVISINGILQDPIALGWNGWLGSTFIQNTGGGCISAHS